MPLLVSDAMGTIAPSRGSWLCIVTQMREMFTEDLMARWGHGA